MAIAPQRTAIGIRRHFTTEGVHPYDEVRWARRDARIVNFRDGSVAFEQLGVEVPETWSVNATNILAQKYFRGSLGSPEREWSLKQVADRVVDTITAWGIKDGYFVDDAEAEIFRDELKHLIVHQKAAFNSPVWFNIGVKGVPQQGSACFILSVDDSMDSILNWYTEEGIIFKGGSGAGVNLSRIRSSHELLKGGGTASGPVSFMRGADASAGTIKSGGKTRRAAKMVILDADHPDIEDFIWCKAIEERKARVLRDAGFDMDLDGSDSHSIQYQNANNSVRVTDEFMQAVEDGADWELRARTDGEVVRRVPARDLFRQVAHAAWECADPGMQFDTTINRWHTAPNTGRINGSNPCFPGSARVHTDKGLIPFAELFDRANKGETFGVYTHDATNVDVPDEQMVLTGPEAFMITGYNDIVRLRFDNGMELRCTPGHRIFTENRGYVEARHLVFTDEVKLLDLPAPAVNADPAIPVSSDPDDYRTKGDHAGMLRLPDEWSPEFAHYLGWLIGDGSTSGSVVATIYGSAEDRDEILPAHAELVEWVNGDRPVKVSERANGTAQLRMSRRAFKRFVEALGVRPVTGPEKSVPWSIEQAPEHVVAAFLRGLFDADGCVVTAGKNRYVGLGSTSPVLLQGIQRLLTTFGVTSRVYQAKKASKQSGFSYVNRDGESVTYGSAASYDLRITSGSVVAFAEHIGFRLSRKAALLRELVMEAPRGTYVARRTAHILERSNDGVELTYNLSEPRNHSYVVDGVVVRNCSEYMHLDNSACNLASLNLMKYLGDDGSFDAEAFKAAVEVVFTGQEIIVGNADYPTEKIAESSRRFRELGIGYANLGALLMANGLPYDSDEGRAWAGAITALMTGHAYATSARTAARMGPFAGYHDNAEPMVNVLRMHQAEAAKIDEELVPPELLSAAQESWDEAVELAEQYGVRNSQASVLAPTGCLVGGSLVSTGRGLVRLRSLGDPDGPKWQELDVQVATDEGPRDATKFYVNGLEPVMTVETSRGHRVQGTATHRIKVVEPASGKWVWRRFGDIRTGDVVPLALGSMVGEPREVVLPPLADAYWTGEHHARSPRQMTAALAELIGYFMGDGSLHSRGLRLCVTNGDFDVVDRLQVLTKECFGIPAKVTSQRGYDEVRVDSVRVALWWEACGFAKRVPNEGHSGKGYVAHIPDAVLDANDVEVYGAFLRGLYEADGDTSAGYPTLENTSIEMVRDVQTLLQAMGFPTTLSVRNRDGSGSWGKAPLASLRLLNASYSQQWLDRVGFMGDRKNASVHIPDPAVAQTGRKDYIPVTRALVDRLAPANDRLRRVLLMEVARNRVSRQIASELFERTGDPELAHLLAFSYDVVTSHALRTEELTYDLSVPDNVTYVANGFVSHNTIGLLMDCDTTGVEPDLGLVKTKKLVGGGTMSIVNQTVPRALSQLGYGPEQVEDVISYIDEHKTIVGAPHVTPEHLAVFACSMGDNTIHYSGHVRMMGAVQPFISGAISKCVTGDTLVAGEDGLVRIGRLYEGEEADTFRPEHMLVASIDGSQKTDAFYYGGRRPVRRFELRSGHSVTGTPNHRVMVADGSGLSWRRLDELTVGDEVAIRYGTDTWASVPARIVFVDEKPHGNQSQVQVPTETSEDLAFFLGAYASEGCTVRSVWSIRITNSVDEVLERVASVARSAFGVRATIRRPANRCPFVEINSKTISKLLMHLGCGSRASEKRIPDVVLRSPRSHVLAFLQGLALDAYVTATPQAKWAICVDSKGLLDDLQAVLTNLGVLHSRISKHNPLLGKSYDEVYASGRHAQALAGLVPFLEPSKREAAAKLLARTIRTSSTDVVPGASGSELFALLPDRVRARFRYLIDERSERVSRPTLERISTTEGVHLPGWLATVLRDGLHFSPVVEVADAGVREVFDLSVPTTHAFVGNGVVNHNTVNMPEDVTVEDVEQLHIDAWKLGIKAVAIYRDNCKVAQPLSTTKKEGALAEGGDASPPGSEAEAKDRQVAERIVELEEALEHERQRKTESVVVGAVRERLPRQRRSKTFAFRVADCEGYVTVGEYEDGRPGEVFVKVSKQGSTLAGIMDAFSISISLGLQHGVPLATYVRKYSNMKFEPAGITDDAELRIASSLVDYIFRRVALDYLSYDERLELGVLSTSERTQPTLPGVEESTTPSVGLAEQGTVAGTSETSSPPVTGAAAASEPLARAEQRDAPFCYSCGNVMQRSGSCYVCPSCGSTSGCS